MTQQREVECGVVGYRSYGVIMPEAMELFRGEFVAFSVWVHAIMTPDGAMLTKNSIKDVFGIGEYQWDKMSKFLRSNDLMEIEVIKDCKGKFFKKKIMFFTWEGRLSRIAERENTVRHKINDTVFHNIEKIKDNDQPCLWKPAHTIPEGGCKGGVGGTAPQEPLNGIELIHPSTSEVINLPSKQKEMTASMAYEHRFKFLEYFKGNNTFQTFDDKGRSRKDLIKIFHNDTRYLEELNRKGAGVFLTINETDVTGRKRENITKIRAVFVDLDGADPNPVLNALPNLMVESSPGKYHAYWFVKDFPLEGFTDVQKRIAEMFNGDNKVHDLPRILRVPGYMHQKGEPFCSRIVFEYDTEPMTYAEVVEKFPPKPVKQWSSPKRITTSCDSGDYKGGYGTSKGNRNNGLARFVGGMVKRNFDRGHIEQEAVKWGTSCSPPMNQHEIIAVVNSVSRYGA